ncbi:hypothetical protein [Cetobacterium sp.]|uniref:hypothetical protein n=1 Tax=Cetobacterium sp. TaxID=2071632 RepID=UPI003EE77E9E
MIDNNLIAVNINIPPYPGMGVDLILDNDLNTYYGSIRSIQGQGLTYGEIIFEFKEHIALDRFDFYTELNLIGKNSWGRIQSYEILYQNDLSTLDWTSLIPKTEFNDADGWRENLFQPIYAKKICIRVHDSYGGFILINNIRAYENFQTIEELNRCFEKITSKEIYLKEDLSLSTIKNIKEKFSENKEIIKVLDIIKHIYLSESKGYKNIKISPSKVSIKEYSKKLRGHENKSLNLLGIKLEKNKHYLINCNSECEFLLFSTSEKQPSTSGKLLLKEGFNKVFLKVGGELLIENIDDMDLTFKVFGSFKSSIFKMGDDKFKDFLERNENEENVYIEGKNFLAYTNKNWIRDNFDEHRFVDSVVTLDAVLDYVDNLLDIAKFNYERTPIKRKFWIGNLEDGLVQGNCELGSYMGFGKNYSLYFNNGVHKLVTPGLCRVLAEDLVSKSFFPLQLRELLVLGFEKTLELKYTKTLLMKETYIENLFIKLLLYSNSDIFISRLFGKYCNHSFIKEEKPLDKMVLWMSEVLMRNCGKLFSDIGCDISGNIMTICQKFPNFTMDINNLTLENYKQFQREEKQLFNAEYLNAILKEGE